MDPKRIASLLASGTEILYALGLGERVVAVSHECDFPEEVRAKPRATYTRVRPEAASREIDEQVRGMISGGQALYEIDVPLLEQLKPELIVTQAQCDVCAVRYEDVVDAVERSAALSKTHVVALNPMRLEDVFRDILHVGEMANAFERAKSYVTALRARVEVVRQRVSGIPLSQRPRTICVEWSDPVMVAANWTPELVQIAGGDNGLTKAGMHSSYSNWDEIARYRPEVIVVAPCGFDLLRSEAEMQTLAALPGWNDLPAVRNERVFVCDGNAYFNRSGPRLIETLELLAYFLQPGKFSPPQLGPNVWRQWRR